MSSCFSRLMNSLLLEPLKTLTSHSTHRTSVFRLPKSKNCVPYQVPPLLTPGPWLTRVHWNRTGKGQPKSPRLHFPELRGDGDRTRGRGTLQTEGGLFPGWARKWEGGRRPGSWSWAPESLVSDLFMLANWGLIRLQM